MTRESKKDWIIIILMIFLLAGTSILFRLKIRQIDNDPVYQEVCVYPTSPEHNCCPEHAELHKEKERRIDNVWELAFLFIMIESSFNAHFIRDMAEKKPKEEETDNNV